MNFSVCNWFLQNLQVVAKLHSILRPFLLRRLKSDVEQMLPRKKEIILYATMTDHQKNFTDHLLNKTLEDYLREKAASGSYGVLLMEEIGCVFWISGIWISIR